tara:strand:+ start:65 stop:772 length:708 start_codon:yes stop_codon:yes gene_type:complete
MLIIPAIDILNGKCVRLFQGDYNKKTIYNDNPLEVANKWVSYGIKRLHIIDLDGAKSGFPKNIDLISKIIKTYDIPIQIGGGIRSIETAKSLINTGVKKIILSTNAINNPEMIKNLCKEIGKEYVVISIDAVKGFVSINGWTQKTKIHAIDLINEMNEIGINQFIYTDIDKDGTLDGPNYKHIKELINPKYSIIAAGGITNIEHLKNLKDIGVYGSIIGKAIYTGNIKLNEALNI